MASTPAVHIQIFDPNWSAPPSLLGTPNVAQDASHVTTVLVMMTLGWLAFSRVLAAVLRIFSPKSAKKQRQQQQEQMRKSISAANGGETNDANTSEVSSAGEYKSRITSLVHSTLATAYCIYIAVLRFQQAASTETYFSNLVCLHTPRLADEQYLCCFVCAYFIYDTIGLFTGDYFNVLYLVHHGASIAVLLELLFGPKPLGIEAAVGIGFLECSGPFLHMRWLLNAHKWDVRFPNSVLWSLIEWSYLLSFFLFRVVFGNYLIVKFNTYFCPRNPLFSGLLLAVLFAYSSVFFVGVVKQKLRGEKWVA